MGKRSPLLNYDDNGSRRSQARTLRLANNLVSNCKFVTPPHTLFWLTLPLHCLFLTSNEVWPDLVASGHFPLERKWPKIVWTASFPERNRVTVEQVYPLPGDFSRCFGGAVANVLFWGMGEGPKHAPPHLQNNGKNRPVET